MKGERTISFILKPCKIFPPFSLSFLEWGEIASTWYIVHHLAYCTIPGWWTETSVQQSLE
jgi:hypothetical protein